jgi:flagellar hook-associated protein 2
MQNDQADLISKKQLLSGLGSAISGLAGAVQRLGLVGETKAASAFSSNSDKVSVTAAGAVSGSHVISEVTSVARAASETSAAGYATADTTTVSSTGTMQLVLGTTTKQIVLGPGKNNLNGLRDAINALGIGVTATVLNTGAVGAPYFLSVAATSTGVTTLQLRDTPDVPASNILTTATPTQGANAVFKLDGLPVTRSDNVVSGVIPNVTFTILGTTGVNETVHLSFASDRSQMADALADLASSYNSVVDLVNAQIGEGAGLLSGDSLIRQTQSALRELTSHRSNGSTIRNLADLGIELDSAGRMSFKEDRLGALSTSELSEAFGFLGSTTTEFGGLWRQLNTFSDPLTGLVKLQQEQYDAADDRLTVQISELAERVNVMQTSLSARLQSADTLLALLESQQALLSASVDSLNLALYGKNDG